MEGPLVQHKSNAGYQFKLIRSNDAMGMGSTASCKQSLLLSFCPGKCLLAWKQERKILPDVLDVLNVHEFNISHYPSDLLRLRQNMFQSSVPFGQTVWKGNCCGDYWTSIVCSSVGVTATELERGRVQSVVVSPFSNSSLLSTIAKNVVPSKRTFLTSTPGKAKY